ncbi:MAG: LysR family transcriptional regulator [Fretibacterium sp.]|nr:LysR family transcriptional regulator [Fretibacterium sp.]
MEFNKLQYLLKVADIGNFTKAAEDLYMTQPALSHLISKLEREEGIKIFDRSSNPITLTYEGEFYIETARQILALNNQLQQDLADITSGKKGRLTIGIPPARAAFMLPQFLPEYARRYPDIQLYTVEHNSRQLREDVQRGDVDFAILPVLQGFENFDKINLYEEELFLVAKTGSLPEESCLHLPNGESVIRLECLRNEPFILLKHGHGMRYALDVLFDYNGYKPKIVMETTNNETALGLAAAGMGLAVVPFMTVEPLRNVLPIKAYKISEAGMKWTVAAILRLNACLSVHTRDCIDLMREIFKSQASGR